MSENTERGGFMGVRFNLTLYAKKLRSKMSRIDFLAFELNDLIFH